ncbi:MAG: hypothetical protein KDD34_00830, partial [Bdellovibrionales bacterium]|nr:hypothetical protein [Bdellovibrionales bacterium]
ILSREDGSLALDFIFAFTLIFGFTVVLFSFAITLSAVEMTQYLTFSAARAFYAGHITVKDQTQQAKNKYEELLQTDAYAFLNKGTWFEILPSPFVGNAPETMQELSQYDQGGEPNRFEGVVTFFVARVLSYSSPFFGSTDPDGDGRGSKFSTHIGSYLGREPTTEECKAFTEQRWKAIRNLDVANGGTSYSTGTSNNDYVVIMDNGC